MSTHENEKALEVEQEVAPAGVQSTIDDPERKLPPELWIQIVHLQPGDAQTLVALTRRYPDFIDAILTQAASTAGNQTVSQAIEMLASNPADQAAAAPAPARGRPMQYDYSVENFKYDESVLTLEGGDIVGDHIKLITMYPELRSKILNGLGNAHPGLFDEALERLAAREQSMAKGPTEKEITEGQGGASGGGNVAGGGPAAENEVSETESQSRSERPQEEAKEASWITGAKRYNAAHPEELAEFNRVTKDACVGPDGVVDPALVSDWQAAHGCTADGRIGPATVDAAKRAAGIGKPPPMTAEDLADLE